MPNTSGASISLDNRRINAGFVISTTGEWWLTDGGRGKFIGAIGTQISGSVRYNTLSNPQLTTSSEGTAPATTDGVTPISLDEGLAALSALSAASNKTYNVANVSLADSVVIADRHPILLTSKQRNLLSQLLSQYPDQTLPDQALGNRTIGMVLKDSETLLNMLARAGGVRNAASAKVAQEAASAKIPPTSAMLTSAEDSLQQQQQLASSVVEAFGQLPNPEQLRSLHEQAEKLNRYDPRISASVTATGAYMVPVLPAAHLAAGVALGAGVELSRNGVTATRSPDGSISDSFASVPFSTTRVFLGSGDKPAAALPPEIAQQLGIQGNGVGAYVSAERTHFSQAFGSVTHSQCQAVVNMRHKISGGETVGQRMFFEAGYTGPCSDMRPTVRIGIQF